MGAKSISKIIVYYMFSIRDLQVTSVYVLSHLLAQVSVRSSRK